MTSRVLRALLVGSLAVFAFAPTSSAVELGSRCIPTALPTVGHLAVEMRTTEFVVPSDGVITRWGTTLEGVPQPIYLRLVVLRGEPPKPTNVVSTFFTQFFYKHLTYTTRLPAKRGDRIGAYGPVPNCFNSSAVLYADFGPYQEIGGVFNLTDGAETRQPSLWAELEPDADKDGFGDVSQDRCAEHKRWRGNCPKASAAARVSVSRKRLNLVLNRPGLARVTVVARARIPDGRLVKFAVRRSEAEGSSLKLKLKIPSSVRAARSQLADGETMRLSVKVKSVGPDNTARRQYRIDLKRPSR